MRVDVLDRVDPDVEQVIIRVFLFCHERPLPISRMSYVTTMVRCSV